MADVKVGKIKDFDLLLSNVVSERKPPVTSGLIAHLPLDGSLNHHAKVWSKVKVLGYYGIASHYWYDWFNTNCTLTNSANLTAVSLATAQTYDLIVADCCYAALGTTLMNKLKTFVDGGVSVVCLGNDDRTNVFVIGYTSVAGVIHNINIDPDTLVPTTQYTSVGSGGGADVSGGIDSLVNTCKPYYRRADTNLIMGYIYTSPTSGAGLFFDQEGNRGVSQFNINGFEYVLGLSRGNITSYGEFNEKGLNCYEPSTNMLASVWGDCGFSDFKKSSYTTDGTYKRSIVFDPDATNGVCLEVETLVDVVDWNTVLVLGSAIPITDNNTNFTFTIRYRIMRCEDNASSTNARNTIGVWSHWYRSIGGDYVGDYQLNAGTVLYPQDWKTVQFTTTSPPANTTGKYFQFGFGGVKKGAKYRVDFIQFEKASYGTGFYNGTRTQNGYLKLPIHWGCETGGGNERSLVFKYIPTTASTYGAKSEILGMGIESTPITTNYIAIRRGAEYGSHDNLDFTFQDGSVSSGSAILDTATVIGINARLNHELYLGVGWSLSSNKTQFWAYDATTSEKLLDQRTTPTVAFNGMTNLTPNFNIGGGTDMSCNGIISDVGIYNRLISQSEFMSISSNPMNVASDGLVTTNKIVDIPTSSATLNQAVSYANSSENLTSPIWTGWTGAGFTETKAFINGGNCTSLNITGIGDHEQDSTLIPVDPNCGYELSVWINAVSKAVGNFYFGYHAFNSSDVNISSQFITTAGTPTGTNNVYPLVVYNGQSKLKYGQWYQLKMYLLPNWFDIVNQSNKFKNGWLNDFLVEADNVYAMPSTTAKIRWRLLNYYNAGTSAQINYAYPTINKINPFRLMKDRIVVSNFKEGVSV